jgi:hypothetical protein
MGGREWTVMVLSIALATSTGSESSRQEKKIASVADTTRAKAGSIVPVREDTVKQADKMEATTDSAARADSAAGSPRNFAFRKVENTAFGVGERLVFTVSYGFIKAGTAVMAVPSYDSVAGRPCYRVEFTVNSLPSFSWIYRVEDRYLTLIDTETIAPWRFEQYIREGSYKRDFVADFDQVNNVAYTTEGEFPIPEYVHDIMSAFYYARTFDFSGFQRGDYITLYNFYKDKSHELRVKFLGRQELEVKAGTFRTVVLEPLVKEGGLFKSEGRIVIWLTDDERKIPVRVNTKVIIGSIDTELDSYSGLIGPLKARIK